MKTSAYFIYAQRGLNLVSIGCTEYLEVSQLFSGEVSYYLRTMRVAMTCCTDRKNKTVSIRGANDLQEDVCMSHMS